MAEKYAGHTFTPVDTTLPIDHTQRIDELSGRQGDNMRTAYIQLMQTSNGVQTPWNLGGYSVQLGGKDYSGRVKLTNTATIMNPIKGLVALKIPAQFYQAVGQYQQAFLRILQGTQVVSTVDVEFNVFENGLAMSTTDSTNYIASIDDQIKQLNTLILPLDTKLSTLNSAADTIEDTFKAYLKEAQSLAVAKTGTKNTFAEEQTFAKTGHFLDSLEVKNALNAGSIYTGSGAWKQIDNAMKAMVYDSGFMTKGFSYLSGGAGGLLMRQTKIGTINTITISGHMHINVPMKNWDGWHDMIRIPALASAGNVQLITRENPADNGVSLWFNLVGDKIQIQKISGGDVKAGWTYQLTLEIQW